MKKHGFRLAVGAGGMLVAGLLSGCNGFFVDPNTTGTGTGTTGSSTADYVYVAEGAGTLAELTVGSGAITAISGSPLTVPSPLASVSSVTVSRSNAFVFVGGDGGIISYSIGTDGALTEVTDGAIGETANFVSLDTSPDGQWLFGLDAENNQVWVFSINTSTGVLTLLSPQYQLAVGGATVQLTTATGLNLKVSPSGGFVAVAIGVAGDELFTLNTSTGALTAASSVDAPAAGFSDDSVGFDGNSSNTTSHLFVGRGITSAGTSQVVSFPVSSAGALSSGTGYNSGEDPYALLTDSSGSYLYSANKGDDTISGFSIASGALTALTGSPFANGDKVTALAEDINNQYIIAAAQGGTHDLILYSLNPLTPGALSAISTYGTGTAQAVAVAATHPQ